jgi:purine-nucleoside phosphorylase
VNNFESVELAANHLLDRVGRAPDIVLIMGSGISVAESILLDVTRVRYGEIPNFPAPTVSGHSGQVVSGKVGSLRVLVFQGRVHLYEGRTIAEVSFCARVVGRCGAKAVLLTNAAGAINPHYVRGQLMLFTDHINLLGINPLSGPNEDRWGPRFVDQSEVYDRPLRNELKEAASACGVPFAEGVYAAVPGPSYETPAEIRYLRTIGADAVGMSTVPEAIVARHMGLRVAGISLLTNTAGGDGAPLQHSAVVASAESMQASLTAVLARFLAAYQSEPFKRSITPP